MANGWLTCKHKVLSSFNVWSRGQDAVSKAATGHSPALAPILRTMKKNLLIIWTGVIITSCGLVSKYQNGQHSVYAKMLTQTDKEQINENGEITKDIELGNPVDNGLLKGTLRIMKTENEEVFNFIEVGQWIEHGRYGNSGQLHNIESRDTITYDNNGNTVLRRVYDKQDGVFRMTNDWTSEIISGSFIQHFKVYNKGILIADYSKKVLDSSNPKSDLQKRKISVGTDKGYYQNGKLAYIKTYDQEGKLVSEEKYGR